MKATILIKGSPAMTGSEDAGFELFTDGEYYRKGGVSTFSYEESDLTGSVGLLTTCSVEPDRVILRRGEEVEADMVFAEDKKHHFLYDTPFGSITMGIDTRSIKKNMRDDGGSIEIRYDLEVDNVAVSQNLFKIDIIAQ